MVLVLDGGVLVVAHLDDSGLWSSECVVFWSLNPGRVYRLYGVRKEEGWHVQSEGQDACWRTWEVRGWRSVRTSDGTAMAGPDEPQIRILICGVGPLTSRCGQCSPRYSFSTPSNLLRRLQAWNGLQ
jgi:hypothetical protein